ncbi:TonB-dependent receptor [Pseudodonghicola flavimaris]|uniref:TonB-dependent receptor plug domain-containing protein n=1 Tax=Pseudodonghicola flavimaris TaxID=3050036 RepID=A0ABT7F694_9RHOB|nr:TonB-dependent receptor plug domain-containing protein [Pseudodonghicola flavimaris]MDK3020133.1 TonB-dependent receptor plug domain-containing protein [Pseudodonghicola flavimaris]
MRLLFSPPSRRRRLLGTTALLLSTLTLTPLSAQEMLELDPILVEQEEGEIRAIDSSDEGAGATVLSGASTNLRSDGSGDANTALATLPHVQAQRPDSSDAGSNVDDVLDLKPLELSISGASVTENNIMLNGVGVNSITGNASPTTSGDLSRDTGTPAIYAFYGLHSQSQFIPTSFVESVEVLDSDIPARYGGFQGGVIKYRLREANPEKKEGSFVVNYGTHDWTSYVLGTEDGDNPDDQPKPEWTKLEYAIEMNQPLTERSALRFGFSRRYAEGRKSMDPQYVEPWAENDSRSDFYGLSYVNGFLNGGKLTLGAYVTDYSQGWDSDYADGFHVDVDSRNILLDSKYEREWDSLSIAGLEMSNAKLTLRGIYQNNRSSNENDKSAYYNWYGSYPYGGEAFYTDAFSGWCEGDATATSLVGCRTGGYGDTYYKDTHERLEAMLEADVARGNFAIGGAIEHIDASRSASGFSYYSTTTRIGAGDAFDAFICADGDDSCLADQYFNRRIIQDPYDVSVEAWKAEAFAELEQTWGTFSLRAGLRADYNDVFHNFDLAPRLTGTWRPSDRLEVSLGANRYYSDNFLAYAIHDAVPRGLNQTRGHDATTGEVGTDWTTAIDLGRYSYTQGNLDTPYNDELSLKVVFRDSWTDGVWRLSGIYRDGKDQFAASTASSSTSQELTNDGWTRYKSVSLEYEKLWAAPGIAALDSVGLYVSGVWADRSVSNNSYFLEDEGSYEFISYHGQSYTTEEFDGVTGNLDIPVRSTLELRSSWKQGRFGLGIGADITFGYDGTRDSGSNETLTHAVYGSQSHNIYTDYKFSTAVSAFLTARLRLAELQTGTVDLNLKVANLFNDTGGATSTDDNPWIEGRSFYFGTSVTW